MVSGVVRSANGHDGRRCSGCSVSVCWRSKCVSSISFDANGIHGFTLNFVVFCCALLSFIFFVLAGNLELVAAAKLYQRNITVYSATLSVFTIECDAEASGPDLLLSFHSGDHYNSVRPNAGNSKYSRMSSSSRSRKLTKHSSGSSSRRSLSDTVTTSTSTLSVATPTAQECGSESYSAVQPQDSNIVVATVVGIDSAPVVKKNAQCPCGSGKRYKRCCWAKLKEEKKEERRRQNRRERDREISDSEDRRRSKSRDEDEAVGGFKVLAI